MTLRTYALVKVDPETIDRLKTSGEHDSPLLSEDNFVFLGEIPNMPDHCVVAGFSSGRVIAGFHTNNFVELDPDEV